MARISREIRRCALENAVRVDSPPLSQEGVPTTFRGDPGIHGHAQRSDPVAGFPAGREHAVAG